MTPADLSFGRIHGNCIIFVEAQIITIRDKRGAEHLAYEVEKRQIAEKAYLHYFNDELYRRGLISEVERNKMALKIESRKPPVPARTRRRTEMER